MPTWLVREVACASESGYVKKGGDAWEWMSLKNIGIDRIIFMTNKPFNSEKISLLSLTCIFQPYKLLEILKWKLNWKLKKK